VTDRDRALSEEALGLFRRYQTEIVEELLLCPWAERSRTTGAVSERVLLSPTLDEQAALEAIVSLEAEPGCEIGILLWPRLHVSLPELERFVSRVVTLDAERRELGTAPFAIAAFHPDAKPDRSDPERLIPFLRRTPDPTLQLVRHDALDRVRDGFQEGTAFMDASTLATLDFSEMKQADARPLRQRIAQANDRTVERLGVAQVEARLLSILDDRNATYERLGEPRR
jgi:hypothetical protein